MRSLRWGLIQCDWCPCTQWKFGHKHMRESHAEIKTEIDRGDASISRGTPRVVGSPLKGGDRHGLILLSSPQKEPTLPALWFQTSASRAPRQCIFTGSGPQPVIPCYSSPSSSNNLNCTQKGRSAFPQPCSILSFFKIYLFHIYLENSSLSFVISLKMIYTVNPAKWQMEWIYFFHAPCSTLFVSLS